MMLGALVTALVLALEPGPAPQALKGSGDPPPPRSREIPDVEAWIAAYVNDDGFAFVGQTEHGAYLVDLSSVRVLRDGAVRFWTKIEEFSPRPMEDIGLVRSSNTLHEVECDEQRARMLAKDYYRESNLRGEKLFGADLDSGWAFARPNTMTGLLTDAVCSYVAELALEKKDDGAPPPSPGR